MFLPFLGLWFPSSFVLSAPDAPGRLRCRRAGPHRQLGLFLDDGRCFTSWTPILAWGSRVLVVSFAGPGKVQGHLNPKH